MQALKNDEEASPQHKSASPPVDPSKTSQQLGSSSASTGLSNLSIHKRHDRLKAKHKSIKKFNNDYEARLRRLEAGFNAQKKQIRVLKREIKALKKLLAPVQIRNMLDGLTNEQKTEHQIDENIWKSLKKMCSDRIHSTKPKPNEIIPFCFDGDHKLSIEQGRLLKLVCDINNVILE